MAAKLQCEICGGKLVGKPGGIFECENCGTEYSTEWAKAKIQEITGTVKVEGTVEVTGKVQIDGPVKVEGGVNRDSLLKRVEISLNDKEWQEAKNLCEQVLSIDPTCAEAYLDKLLAILKHSTLEDVFLPELELLELEDSDGIDAEAISAWKNAKLFSGEVLKAKLDSFPGFSKQRWADINDRVRQIAPVQELVHVHKDVVFALDSVGKVHYFSDDPQEWHRIVESWPPVKQLVFFDNGYDSCEVALFYDGTVGAASQHDYNYSFRPMKEMRLLAGTGTEYGQSILVGIDEKGRLLSCLFGEEMKQTGYRPPQRFLEAEDWADVEKLFLCQTYVGVVGDLRIDYVVGLTANGTIKSTLEKETAFRMFGWGQEDPPYIENGRAVVAVGRNRYGNESPFRIGFAPQLWEENSGKYYDSALPKDKVPVAVEGYCYDAGRITVLTEDGHVLYKDRYNGKPFVDLGWKLFECAATFEQERDTKIGAALDADRKAEAARAEVERKAAAEKAETERKAKIAALKKEKADLQAELANLKGLFSGGKRRQIEARLAEIEEELKKLE